MSAALVLDGARLAFREGRSEIWALDSVSAEIEGGAVTCLVGPNGAGKTSLLRAAARLLPLTAGACALFGRPLAALSRDELAKRVAYLPQGGETAWQLRVREIVALGRLPHGAGLTALSEKDLGAIESALTRADVAELADRRVDQLSAGERARVLFARALATEADLVLADEPAAHLDPEHQLRLMELLGEEARRGAAVVVTLHELSLAARCARVVVLDKGRVAADGPPAEALSDDVLAQVFRIAVVRAGQPSVPVSWRRL